MKLIKTKINELIFWYRADDKFVGQRIALGKYEEYETMLMLSQVNKNSVVVDVGANIGYYTLLLAQKCKQVYAVEPDKDCFEILKKNVEENGFNNVVLFNVAVGDKKEKNIFIKDSINLGNSRLIGDKRKTIYDKRVIVNCLKLDDILSKEQKIDLIKIDSQGWEPQVIEGAKKIIKRDSPTLFLEYTPSEYKDEKMIKFLRDNYQNIWSIDYWYFICQRGIKVNKKTGYVDLWIKNKFGIRDYVDCVKYVRLKKIIKFGLAWLTNTQ